MKIAVDVHAAMKASVKYVLNDLRRSPVEIELTDNPNDFLGAVSNIADD